MAYTAATVAIQEIAHSSAIYALSPLARRAYALARQQRNVDGVKPSVREKGPGAQVTNA
jgi:hypothetical protein